MSHATAVRTNNSVCGAFRGFGANQAQFAMEGVMDRLAEQVGISGWEMRNRNAIEPGSVWGPGQIMDDGSAGARQCLDAVKDALRRGRKPTARPWAWAWPLKNSGLATGSWRSAQGCCALRRRWHGRGASLLDRDGPGCPYGGDAGGGRRAGYRCRQDSVLCDTDTGTWRRTDNRVRGTLMGAGSVQSACQAAVADGRQVGVDYEGEYRVDWTNKLGEEWRTRSCTRRLVTPPRWLLPTKRPVRSRGRRRPRCRSSRQSAAV